MQGHFQLEAGAGVAQIGTDELLQLPHAVSDGLGMHVEGFGGLGCPAALQPGEQGVFEPLALAGCEVGKGTQSACGQCVGQVFVLEQHQGGKVVVDERGARVRGGRGGDEVEQAHGPALGGGGVAGWDGVPDGGEPAAECFRQFGAGFRGPGRQQQAGLCADHAGQGAVHAGRQLLGLAG